MTGDPDPADPNSGPRVLVVGATGTVGSAVCAALTGGRSRGGSEPPDTHREYPWPTLDASPTIRAGARDPAAAAVPADETVPFDYDRPETWGPALEAVDAVFLLYPPGGDTDPVTAFADAAVRVGVDRVAFLSTLNAGDLPILPHRSIERHLAGLPVSATSLRAGYFHQNLAEVHAEDVRDHDEVFVPAGDARTTFVDARDVGAAAAVVLTEDGPAEAGGTDALRTEHLTGEVLSYRDVASALSDALDRPIRYADPSPIAFARRMRGRGAPWGFVGFMLAQYTIGRFRLVPVDRTSGSLAALLDRRPTPFRAFADDYRSVWLPDGSVDAVDDPDTLPGRGTRVPTAGDPDGTPDGAGPTE
jgi:uncharacterized protein YbjT (DUF2867 family)